MPHQNRPSSNTPWVIAVAAAAFAIGVGTSDSIKDAIFDIQNAIILNKSGKIPQILTELPSQAQAIHPSSFAVMSAVPPENVSNVTTVGLVHLHCCLQRVSNRIIDIYSARFYHGNFERKTVSRLSSRLLANLGIKPNAHAHRRLRHRPAVP